jgi:hypothetical protein
MPLKENKIIELFDSSRDRNPNSTKERLTHNSLNRRLPILNIKIKSKLKTGREKQRRDEQDKLWNRG